MIRNVYRLVALNVGALIALVALAAVLGIGQAARDMPAQASAAGVDAGPQTLIAPSGRD